VGEEGGEAEGRLGRVSARMWWGVLVF